MSTSWTTENGMERIVFGAMIRLLFDDTDELRFHVAIFQSAMHLKSLDKL